MFFKTPSPEELFSVPTFWKKVFIHFSVLVLPLILLVMINFYKAGINEKTIAYNVKLLLFAVSAGYAGSISEIGLFHKCHIKHLKLIEKYGDAYLRILKTELENTTVLGHLREHWETFEKIMKEEEKLNPDILIKRNNKP